METVTFNCGGEPLVINPGHVAGIKPFAGSDKKTLLAIYGHTYKVRGPLALIQAALAWESGPIIGFDTVESKDWEARVQRAGHGDMPEAPEEEPPPSLTGSNILADAITSQDGKPSPDESSPNELDALLS